MNKLVIVGNGFDLAHGLPTSYKNFIDDFWANIKENVSGETNKNLVYINEAFTNFIDYNPINSFRDFEKNLIEYSDEYGYDYDIVNNLCSFKKQSAKFQVESVTIFKFESMFFRDINIENSIENWVDIENEYYQNLKNIVQDKVLNKIDKKQKVKKLNDEFSKVIQLFSSYLTLNVNQKYHFNKAPIESEKLLGFFEIEYQGLLKDSKNRHPYQQEFMNADQNDLIEFDKKVKNLTKHEIDQKTWFLNFNNTATLDKYAQLINGNHNLNYYGSAKQIQIHGKLGNNEENMINFGFGDEMDEVYKFIENLDDNEYLRNFKSFKYSQNSNYKNLLDYIDSDKFQVFIMGHSCGLSDRTLLNTVFEHKNCRSIKVFYHQQEDGSDNFTEIVQNISRHFNDKKVMRQKIVNKSLCSPLPQDIRFLEKNVPKNI